MSYSRSNRTTEACHPRTKISHNGSALRNEKRVAITQLKTKNTVTMILGHGANTMTLEEARMKLCAQAK